MGKALTKPAKGCRIERLPLASISTDSGTQVRVRLDEATVNEYADVIRRAGAGECDELPPAVVFRDASGVNHLADGFHRHAAHRRVRRRRMACEVRPGDQRAALLYACGANATHGLQRTPGDKRNAVRTLLSDPEWAGWSDAGIGRACNVSHSTVASVRALLTCRAAGEEPSTRTYVTKHGTTATMKVGNLGRRSLLRSPYTFYGGKSKVASVVWGLLGPVQNYIEAFLGSGAVLLARPDTPKIETVNDVNHYISNFWRAVTADPEAVVRYCDLPVSECDLHARHQWLVLSEHAATWRERMRTDPEHFDAKIAGWWLWGACCWIGSGWCDDRGANGPAGGSGERMPKISGGPGQLGNGIHAAGASYRSVNHAKRPFLSTGETGAKGIHRNPPDDTAPSAIGTCAARREWLLDWFGRLKDRLRNVRTCCGDWLRVCDSDSVTTGLGLTGVFFDPPYPRHSDGKRSRNAKLYASDRADKSPEQIRDELLSYCRQRGSNPLMRIVVAGYDTDGYAELVARYGWTEIAWKADGGYGNRGAAGNENAKRERLYCSPHCLTV